MLIAMTLAGATTILSGYGGKQAYNGYQDKKDARAIIEELQAKKNHLKRLLDRYKNREKRFDRRSKKLAVRADVLMERAVTLAEAVGANLVVAENANGIRELKLKLPDLKNENSSVAKHFWQTGTDGLGSVVAGAALKQGAVTAIQRGAIASTGTAIKTLSGAVAKRATLSAAGGGAVAAGGGGIAAGIAALNALSIGGTIAIMGQRYRKRAQEKLREALKVKKDYEHQKRKIESELKAHTHALEQCEKDLRKAEVLAMKIEERADRLESAHNSGFLHNRKSELEFFTADLGKLISMVRA